VTVERGWFELVFLIQQDFLCYRNGWEKENPHNLVFPSLVDTQQHSSSSCLLALGGMLLYLPLPKQNLISTCYYRAQRVTLSIHTHTHTHTYIHEHTPSSFLANITIENKEVADNGQYEFDKKVYSGLPQAC
jgi:hypothetical protein